MHQRQQSASQPGPMFVINLPSTGIRVGRRRSGSRCCQCLGALLILSFLTLFPLLLHIELEYVLRGSDVNGDRFYQNNQDTTKYYPQVRWRSKFDPRIASSLLLGSSVSHPSLIGEHERPGGPSGKITVLYSLLSAAS